jgi:hypothetical protein
MNALSEQQEIFKRNTKQSTLELEAVEMELCNLKVKMEILLKERENEEAEKKLLQDKLKD